MLLVLHRAVSAAALAWVLTTSTVVVVAQADDTLTRTGAAPADSGTAGHGSSGFRLSFYHHDDSGDGNPFLDEELTVIEPVIVLDYNVTDRVGFSGKISYDYVSSASIRRLADFPNQTGASGDHFIGMEMGLSYRWSRLLRLGGSVSQSYEYDYQSFGFSGYVERDLEGKDATLKWSANTYLDRIDTIRFNGQDDGEDERLTVSTTVNWYQILDPHTHSDVGITFSEQSGFLETPYNSAVVEDPSLPPNPRLDNRARGVEITEELPGTRTRGAVFGRVRRLFDSGTSLELGARLYGDSWDVFSVAVEPRVYQWLIDKVLYAMVRYRFYAQTAARNFDDHFRRSPRFRTQDSDLAAFRAHTVGATLFWYYSETVRWDVGSDYVIRSDGLDQIISSLGVVYDF